MLLNISFKESRIRLSLDVSIRTELLFLVPTILVLILAVCHNSTGNSYHSPKHQLPFMAVHHKPKIHKRLTPVAPVAPVVVTPPVQSDYTIPPITNGLAPVISTLPTKENVVFLGIDDGANKQQFELDMMKQNNIKASLFLSNLFISDNPGFFNQFASEGSVIENHTLSHITPFTGLSLDQQRREICDEADLQLKQFGRRPILFRPPGGAWNTDTQIAAADCGMKAVVIWIAKANGGSMQYQYGNSLRPGDIVLMHFRPEFQADMQAFLDAQNAAGLHTELLENWLSQ